jgi:hypothetical protein
MNDRRFRSNQAGFFGIMQGINLLKGEQNEITLYDSRIGSCFFIAGLGTKQRE